MSRRMARTLLLVVLLTVAAGFLGVAEGKGEEVIKLNFWYSLGGNSGKVVQNLVGKFNETHKTIQVEGVYCGGYAEIFQKVSAALAAKTLPDVAQIGGAPLLATTGAIVKLQDVISKDKTFDKSDIWDVFWEYNSFEDEIWTMPFNNSTPVLYYNKDMFQAAGLDPEKPPKTWEELILMAKALTRDTNNDGRIDQWGFNTHSDTHWYLTAMILQNGGKIVDNKATKVLFDGPEGVQALQLWSDLVHVHKVMPAGGHMDATTDFTVGKLAMFLRSSATLKTIEERAKFKVGVAGMPAMKEKAMTIGGASLVLFKTGDKRQEAAWEFIKWMTSPENIAYLNQETGYIPIRKSVLNLPSQKAFYASHPNAEVSARQADYAKVVVFPELGTSDEEMRKAVEAVELKKADPKTSLQTAAEVIQKAIDERLGKK